MIEQARRMVYGLVECAHCSLKRTDGTCLRFRPFIRTLPSATLDVLPPQAQRFALILGHRLFAAFGCQQVLYGLLDFLTSLRVSFFSKRPLEPQQIMATLRAAGVIGTHLAQPPVDSVQCGLHGHIASVEPFLQNVSGTLKPEYLTFFHARPGEP